MRVAHLAVMAIAASGIVRPAPAGAQSSAGSSPVFRADVDLLTLGVTALDDQGRQLTDLDLTEWRVTVDGETRAVVSADFIRLADPTALSGTDSAGTDKGPALGIRTADRYVSTNRSDGLPGRLVLLVVDQGSIGVGGGDEAADEARRIVDRLQPPDHVAVAIIPAPGSLLDFTRDHRQAHNVLGQALGRAVLPGGRFNLTVAEANLLARNPEQRRALEILERECGVAPPRFESDRCALDVIGEANSIIGSARDQAAVSAEAFKRLLDALAPIEGAKQVIYLTQGVGIDGLASATDELIASAAEADATIDVLLLKAPSMDVNAARPTSPGELRTAATRDLERLASQSGGTLYQESSTQVFVLDRVVRALDGYYQVAVAARPSDRRDGWRHVDVKAARPGVRLRMRRQVRPSGAGSAASAADAISRVLRSPRPATELPMRMSTWTLKEPGSSRQRVVLSVEAEHLAERSLDYLVGMTLTDGAGRARVSQVASQSLRADRPGWAVYTSTMLVEPGSYRLRVAMSDAERRVGSLERRVDVFLVDDASPASGDLILGTMSSGSLNLEPAVEPIVAGQPVGAIVEGYLPPDADRARLSTRLTVLRSEDSPELLSVAMSPAGEMDQDVAVMQAFIDAPALPPGRYLARATMAYDGRVIGAATRPFRVAAGTEASERPGATATATAAASVPQAVTSAIGRLFPAYDQQDLLAPSIEAAALAQLASRTPAADAVGAAKAGEYTEAAMAALASGDQTLAAFFKGVDLLRDGRVSEAAMQLQLALTSEPSFVPARVYLGGTFAADGHHAEAAGLFQSGATRAAPMLIGRLAGEEWLRAGEYERAIAPLARAAARAESGPRTRRALGLAYVLANRPSEGLEVLRAYLPDHADDRAALLAGLYAMYAHHRSGERATLAADRMLAARWLEAYEAAGGTLPLPATWVAYLDALP